jgi:hypothetical protein
LFAIRDLKAKPKSGVARLYRFGRGDGWLYKGAAAGRNFSTAKAAKECWGREDWDLIYKNLKAKGLGSFSGDLYWF